MANGSSARVGRVALIACTATLAACITEFPHPLGPVKDGFIEPRLLGHWECTPSDGQGPGELSVVDFDGRQYLVVLAAPQEQATRMRAYATRIRGATMLNAQEIGSKRDAGWQYMEYRLSADGELVLRVVVPSAFESAIESPRKIRKLLERNLDKADFVSDLLACRRLAPGSEPSSRSDCGT